MGFQAPIPACGARWGRAGPQGLILACSGSAGLNPGMWSPTQPSDQLCATHLAHRLKWLSVTALGKAL